MNSTHLSVDSSRHSSGQLSLPTYGLRHVAINVKDAQASKRFYMEVLQMQLEWEPDAQNVYLTSGGHDNLAIHQVAPEAQGSKEAQLLDHLGFALPSMEAVDQWYAWVTTRGAELGAKIAREVKTHRDGARSFYFYDIDGIIIQMIFHPPIAARVQSGR